MSAKANEGAKDARVEAKLAALTKALEAFLAPRPDFTGRVELELAGGRAGPKARVVSLDGEALD